MVPQHVTTHQATGVTLPAPEGAKGTRKFVPYHLRTKATQKTASDTGFVGTIPAILESLEGEDWVPVIKLHAKVEAAIKRPITPQAVRQLMSKLLRQGKVERLSAKSGQTRFWRLAR